MDASTCFGVGRRGHQPVDAAFTGGMAGQAEEVFL
jgi:hypothetical protein